MNKGVLISVIIGIIFTIIVIAVSLIGQNQFIISEKPTTQIPMDDTSASEKSIPAQALISSNKTAIISNNTFPIRQTIITIPFSYVDTNSLMKEALAAKKVSMSNPLKISGGAIEKYCSFYASSEKQNLIEYCTSTELKDNDGKFLGNFHMIGTMDSPTAILGVIQTDPFMSNLDSLKTTYQIMVETIVCECWQDQKPGNLESVSSWIEAVKSHHLEATQITSHSQITGLAQKQLLLEVTTNTEGYLWKFIITN